MDLPRLSIDANETLRSARASAAIRGMERAEARDILGALLDQDAAVGLMRLFEFEPDQLRNGLAFMSEDAPDSLDVDAEERTVELARVEARRLGQLEAGSEHLVLGLLRQRESMAAGVLAAMGVTLDSTREAVRFIHGQVPDWEAPTVLPAFASTSMEMVSSVPPDEDPSLMDMPFVDLDKGASALHRVVGIGLAVEDEGITLEMIALEIRTAAAILHWRTHATGELPSGEPMFSINDGSGTTYEVMSPSWSGSDHEVRGYSVIVPPPPHGIDSLLIVVQSFRPAPWIARASGRAEGRPTLGSWRFEVTLEG